MTAVCCWAMLDENSTLYTKSEQADEYKPHLSFVISSISHLPFLDTGLSGMEASFPDLENDKDLLLHVFHHQAASDSDAGKCNPITFVRVVKDGLPSHGG